MASEVQPTEPILEIDAELCKGCQLCLGVCPKDCIAQELQPLVRFQAMVGTGGVGQGGLKQRLVIEPVADSLFALLEYGCQLSRDFAMR